MCARMRFTWHDNIAQTICTLYNEISICNNEHRYAARVWACDFIITTDMLMFEFNILLFVLQILVNAGDHHRVLFRLQAERRWLQVGPETPVEVFWAQTITRYLQKIHLQSAMQMQMDDDIKTLLKSTTNSDRMP